MFILRQGRPVDFALIEIQFPLRQYVVFGKGGSHTALDFAFREGLERKSFCLWPEIPPQTKQTDQVLGRGGKPLPQIPLQRSELIYIREIPAKLETSLPCILFSRTSSFTLSIFSRVLIVIAPGAFVVFQSGHTAFELRKRQLVFLFSSVQELLSGFRKFL